MEKFHIHILFPGSWKRKYFMFVGGWIFAKGIGQAAAWEGHMVCTVPNVKQTWKTGLSVASRMLCLGSAAGHSPGGAALEIFAPSTHWFFPPVFSVFWEALSAVLSTLAEGGGGGRAIKRAERDTEYRIVKGILTPTPTKGSPGIFQGGRRQKKIVPLEADRWGLVIMDRVMADSCLKEGEEQRETDHRSTS